MIDLPSEVAQLHATVSKETRKLVLTREILFNRRHERVCHERAQWRSHCDTVDLFIEVTIKFE